MSRAATVLCLLTPFSAFRARDSLCEKFPHGLGYFNTWFPGGGSGAGPGAGIGCEPCWRKYVPGGTGCEIKSLMPFPVPFLWFLLTIGILGFLILKLRWPCCRAPTPRQNPVTPSAQTTPPEVALVTVFYHSPREATSVEQMGKVQTEVIRSVEHTLVTSCHLWSNLRNEGLIFWLTVWRCSPSWWGRRDVRTVRSSCMSVAVRGSSPVSSSIALYLLSEVSRRMWSLQDFSCPFLPTAGIWYHTQLLCRSRGSKLRSWCLQNKHFTNCAACLTLLPHTLRLFIMEIWSILKIARLVQWIMVLPTCSSASYQCMANIVLFVFPFDFEENSSYVNLS